MLEQPVRVFDNVIEVEVAVDTAAHAANDVVWQPTEVVGIHKLRGCGIITSVVVVDYDDQGVALDVVFLRSPITVGANNATMAISDLDIGEVLGYVPITAYLDLDQNQIGQARNAGLVIKAADPAADTEPSVWIAGRTTGTPTYATGRLLVKIGVLRG